MKSVNRYLAFPSLVIVLPLLETIILGTWNPVPFKKVMGENIFLLQCKDPIAEVLDTQQRLHDLLFIYEGREVTESGKGGNRSQPRVSRKIFGKGEIIGTRKWARPGYQDEWNEWAGKQVE